MKLTLLILVPEFPRIYRKCDLAKLMDSDNKFFACKFDEAVDNESTAIMAKHAGK